MPRLLAPNTNIGRRFEFSRDFAPVIAPVATVPETNVVHCVVCMLPVHVANTIAPLGYDGERVCVECQWGL